MGKELLVVVRPFPGISDFVETREVDTNIKVCGNFFVPQISGKTFYFMEKSFTTTNPPPG